MNNPKSTQIKKRRKQKKRERERERERKEKKPSKQYHQYQKRYFLQAYEEEHVPHQPHESSQDN